MRIELFGDTNIVTSVSVCAVTAGLNVLINCAERWPQVQRIGASPMFLATNQDHRVVHDCIEVADSDFDASQQCHVVLISENSNDAALLRGLPFVSIEKEQASFLYVPREMLSTKVTLAKFNRPDNQ